jgi:hypothetical protein
VKAGISTNQSNDEAVCLSQVSELQVTEITESLLIQPSTTMDSVRSTQPKPAAADSRPVELTIDEGEDDETSRFGSVDEIVEILNNEMRLLRKFESSDDHGLSFPIAQVHVPSFMLDDITGVEYMAKMILKQMSEKANMEWLADFDETQVELALTKDDVYIFNEFRRHAYSWESMVAGWVVCKYNFHGYVFHPRGWRKHALKVTTGETKQYLLDLDTYVNRYTSNLAVKAYADAHQGENQCVVQTFEQMQVFPMSSREIFKRYMQTYDPEKHAASRSLQSAPLARGRATVAVSRSLQQVPTVAAGMEQAMGDFFRDARASQGLAVAGPARGPEPSGPARRNTNGNE